MAKNAEETHQTEVTLVPTDRIRILNPRVRNPRTFADMVDNIAKIGLKRPITVTRRTGTDPQEYDLVCGQGRLEAFIQLKQKAIPAIVIDADESDCLVMSLVENCARRQHRPIDLMREIGTLRERGYNDRQIGDKIGVSPDYVGMIAGLLERGEERLVTAVETGLLPLNLAIDISKTDAEGAQRALMDAYTQKKLRGKKLAAARRLIEQREARGKKIHPKQYGRDSRNRRPLTSEALVRAYQKEADRQKLLIKKAELTQGRLLFICQAFRTLLEDDHFVTLLRAEGLETMPSYLQDSLAEGAAP
ncbi:ParB N-terminal domain-containing protein [Ponticoccus sp. SC2-23]|nr:plasmid partitioning protein RepB C-terminal domain-containing protein [Alexandriicola marinus]MBM1221340.1 ParB N-terminal domain-containing protein [Ponticoccus sp. SC6-9]MBM1226381.1 ParB N-terminal domain-containing protein [Ponticoccus sp. SC6-15]MBM1230332.1 ParB N-terminal domain-containing protein [Ponticoccus sp. SC6-38]MBM1234855.1 ParB N-terminal domain-containing protein [Ponticoccus sp. SC6-45]MBM1239353.1 ParB N-terminal domain-containing protein [Ponticoccus sp. SC6-49]MBM12